MIVDSIQFLTRKEASCSDLLTYLYNLKTIDLKVFAEVAKLEWATLDQIAEAVDRDRSSIHRCLAKLLSAGLIHKQSKGLKGGGYFHVYNIVEPTKIKEHSRQKVKEISDSLQALIDNFESDLTNHLGKNQEVERSSEMNLKVFSIF